MRKHSIMTTIRVVVLQAGSMLWSGKLSCQKLATFRYSQTCKIISRPYSFLVKQSTDVACIRPRGRTEALEV